MLHLIPVCGRPGPTKHTVLVFILIFTFELYRAQNTYLQFNFTNTIYHYFYENNITPKYYKLYFYEESYCRSMNSCMSKHCHHSPITLCGSCLHLWFYLWLLLHWTLKLTVSKLGYFRNDLCLQIIYTRQRNFTLYVDF